MPMELVDTALRLGVAGLGGLAVGVEREWSARQRARKHDFAGVRTFPEPHDAKALVQEFQNLPAHPHV